MLVKRGGWPSYWQAGPEAALFSASLCLPKPMALFIQSPVSLGSRIAQADSPKEHLTIVPREDPLSSSRESHREP